MKRFYKGVSIAADDAGHAILLDGRPIRTPKRAQLVLPTSALADAVAAEWEAQGDDILPGTMPLTGIANAAIDWVAPDPVGFAAPLAAYAETDLLCYRAPEPPLARVEAEGWNPILAWAEAAHAVEFTLVTGIIHQPQPTATTAALRDALLGHDSFRLAALSPIITIGGSLVIALAHISGAFDSETLWQAVTLDERWQEEQWGSDDEALKQRARHHAEWQAASRFLSLLA